MYILGICLIIELTGGVVALIFRNQVGLWCFYQPEYAERPPCVPWAIKLGVCREQGIQFLLEQLFFWGGGHWKRKPENKKTGQGGGRVPWVQMGRTIMR